MMKKEKYAKLRAYRINNLFPISFAVCSGSDETIIVVTAEMWDRILGGPWTFNSKDPPHASIGLAVAKEIL